MAGADPDRATVPSSRFMAPPQPTQPTDDSPDAWIRPTVLAATIDTVGVLPIFLTGAMAVQLQADIGLEVDSLGVVYASYFGAAAALSIPVGRVSERTGPSVSLRVGTALTCLAMLGVATVVSSPVLLVLFIVLSGLGTSLTRTASSVLLARAVPPSRQGRAFGIKNSAIPVAALISGLALPVIALSIGWQWSYVLGAAVGFGVLLAVPSDLARPPVIARVKPQPDLALRTLALAATTAGFGAASVSSLGAFSVVTAVDAGMSEAAAGILVAVGSLLGLVSRVSVGFVSDRRPLSQMDLAGAMLAAGAVGLVMIAFAGAGFMWIAIPFAYVTGWAFFGTYYLAIVRLNPSAPGTAVGIAQTGAFGGSVIGPIVLGVLADRISFTAAWLTAAGAGAIAAAIAFYIWAVILKEPRRAQAHRC
jgi:MFS family permease